MSIERQLGEWGHVDTYNLSAAEMDLVRRRAERRQILKKEFHRIVYNPYENMKGEGGTPFDPAFQRFASTRSDYYPYFKPNKKNFTRMILMYWVPLAVSIYIAQSMTNSYDKRLRNAEIPWRFRSSKTFV